MAQGSGRVPIPDLNAAQRVTNESVDSRDVPNRKGMANVTVRMAKPTATELSPPRPNPFPQTATIVFGLASASPIELAIGSVDGRRVRILVRGGLGDGKELELPARTMWLEVCDE